MAAGQNRIQLHRCVHRARIIGIYKRVHGAASTALAAAQPLSCPVPPSSSCPAVQVMFQAQGRWGRGQGLLAATTA
jgi:hypothetical protein